MGIVAASMIGYAFFIYKKVFTPNTNFQETERYIYLPTDANYQTAIDTISKYVTDINAFEFVAQKRSYVNHVKSGRFLITKNMTSFELVQALRQNIPVKLAFNNQERIENLAGRIAQQIEPDSLSILKCLQDSVFMKEKGFDKNTMIAMLLPNTYEVYWNTTPEKFRTKMHKEFKNFWTAERIQKADKQGLTPVQATTLASIVHKESVKKDERPRIAKVYLNRLKIGMPLQADPTIIYALKLKDNDFNQVIKRVFNNDLKINSAYNTYVNLGLPPGPIAMPDITAIDAVLNPENNNYIYFCASVTKFGYHEFAEDYAQHIVNAKKYSAWVNSQGINR